MISKSRERAEFILRTHNPANPYRLGRLYYSRYGVRVDPRVARLVFEGRPKLDRLGVVREIRRLGGVDVVEAVLALEHRAGGRRELEKALELVRLTLPAKIAAE